MAAPAVLGYAGPASINDRVVGPLAASIATIAIWEATRSLRWVNFALAVWLLLAPLILRYDGPAARLNSLTVGFLMVLCALVRGKVKGRFGGGWSSLVD